MVVKASFLASILMSLMIGIVVAVCLGKAAAASRSGAT